MDSSYFELSFYFATMFCDNLIIEELACENFGPALQHLLYGSCSATTAYALGEWYYDGSINFVQDYASALQWFDKAAKQGHVAAQINVGYMCQHEQGVQSCDVAKALQWFKLALQTANKQQLANVKALVHGDKLVEWISNLQRSITGVTLSVPCSKVLAAGHQDVIGPDLSNLFISIDLANVIQIASGRHSAIALTSDGQVFGRGKNANGELSLGHCEKQSSWTRIGSNTFAQSISIVAIQCGAEHCMFLTANHQVFTCGGNLDGQLVCKN